MKRMNRGFAVYLMIRCQHVCSGKNYRVCDASWQLDLYKMYDKMSSSGILCHMAVALVASYC